MGVTYYYWLDVVEFSGAHERHGPLWPPGKRPRAGAGFLHGQPWLPGSAHARLAVEALDAVGASPRQIIGTRINTDSHGQKIKNICVCHLCQSVYL